MDGNGSPAANAPDSIPATTASTILDRTGPGLSGRRRFGGLGCARRAMTETIVVSGSGPDVVLALRRPGRFTGNVQYRINRKPHRGRTERADLDALLDELSVGTLATVVDGRPWVVPLLYARDGDRLLLHGSTGAGALRQVAKGAPAAFSVHVVDRIVVAHSGHDSSADYRSAVVYGELTNLRDDEHWDALNRMLDQMIPGRAGEIRDMTAKEAAATMAVALPIVDGHWTMKVRDEGLGEQPAEQTDAWTGTVEVRTVYGPATPAPWSEGRPVPASVQRLIAQHQPALAATG